MNITCKEFQRNMKKYLDALRDGQEVVVRGVRLGNVEKEGYIPSIDGVYTDKVYTGIYERLDKLEEWQRGGGVSVYTPDDRGTEGVQCWDCGVQVAKKLMWVEGEDISMCKGCVRKKFVGLANKFESYYKKLKDV